MTDEEMAHYSAALDEIYLLRGALAYEAQVVEAQTLDLSRLGQGRRKILTERIEAMRRAARGEVAMAYAGTNVKRSLLHAGADECLTRHDWENRNG